MKTLSDAADLMAQLSYNLTSAIYNNKDNPDYDMANAKDSLEKLNLAYRVVYDKLEEEKKNEGDRLDKLLDALEGGNSRTLHAISCVCVALSTMEDHLFHIGEYEAAGRCNKIQHKYLG